MAKQSPTQPDASQPRPRPPWIDTQGLEFLGNVREPLRCLHPERFRAERAVSRDGKSTDYLEFSDDPDDDPEYDGEDFAPDTGRAQRGKSPWQKIDKNRLLLGWLLEPARFGRRLCITTDGGIGKTTLLGWTEAAISQHRPDLLAVCLKLGEIDRPQSAEEPQAWLLRVLVQRLKESSADLERRQARQARAADESENGHDSTDSPHPTARDAVFDDARTKQVLSVYIAQGRLVLLVDALDQTRALEHQVNPKVIKLREFLATDGRYCRVVVTGRPHSVVRYWDDLFAKADWRFARLLPFTKTEVESYLGNERVELLRQLDVDVLHTPRFLEVIFQLPVMRLRGLRTASAVYYECLEHDLELIQNKDLVGRNGTTARLKTGEAEQMLAVLAFEMFRQDNFAGVSATDFHDFFAELAGRHGETLGGHTDRQRWGDQFDLLAQANETLEHGYLDHDGLTQVYWRDPTLQAFFAALWITKHASADDLAWWGQRQFIAGEHRRDEFHYSVWRFATEMPLEKMVARRWVAAMAPLYQPPPPMRIGIYARYFSRTIQDIRTSLSQLLDYLFAPGDEFPRRRIYQWAKAVACQRSTEMIWRSHETVESYLALIDLERGNKSAQVVATFETECLAPYRAEFQSILHGARGYQLKRVAKHLVNEFRDIIPKGTTAQFMMGSPRGEKRRSRDELQHPVTLTRPYAMARYQVTNEQYELFDRGHSIRYEYYDKDCSPKRRCPVIRVSFYDACAFCLWLGPEYRLPTEAEWEFACRAGTETPFHFGEELNGTQANCKGNEPYGTATPGERTFRTTAVGSYAEFANRFGLYDMHGNVDEWCRDWYGENYYRDSLGEDPAGPETGTWRVLRGGSWRTGAKTCRSAYRETRFRDHDSDDVGFRLAKSIS